ncbi:MAG: hypothetical protein GXO57_03640 [Thermodesulfobacteria bacterium]|nr:hypothetical protein [Thermodesulfobacteriota bacterium]
MSCKRTKTLFITVIILVLFLITKGFCINISGDLGFGKTSEGYYIKTQSYSVNFDKEITSRMRFGGNFNYLRSYHKTELGRWQENIRPSIFYSIMNDYFSWFLNYSYNINNFSSGENFLGWNIGSNFRTKYKKFNINFFWNKNKSWSEGLVQNTNIEAQNVGLSINRNFIRGILKGLLLDGGVRYGKSENKANPATSESWNYYLKGSYFKFWRRVSFGLNEEFYYIKNRSQYSLGPTGKYKVEYPLIVINATFNSTLIPGQEFILQIPANKELKGIKFFTDYTFQIEVGDKVKWDIYYSKDRIFWQKVASGVTLPYEFTDSIKYPYIYIKLVVNSTSPGAPTLITPKFVGYYYETQKEVKQSQYLWRNSLNMGFRLPFESFLSLNGGYEISKTENIVQNKRQYINTSFSINKSKKLKPSFSYFYSRNEYQGITTRMDRYSANLAYIPIESIKLATGYTLGKSRENGKVTLKDQNVFVSGRFRFFPGLSSEIITNYSKTRSYELNTETSSYSIQANIFAKPRENLSIEFKNFFSITKTTKQETFRRHEVFITWQVSPFFTLMTTQSIDNKNTYIYSYILYMMPTRKIRINSGFNGYKSKDFDMKSFNCGVFWRFAKRFYFIWNFNWSESLGIKEWVWNARLRFLL